MLAPLQTILCLLVEGNSMPDELNVFLTEKKKKKKKDLLLMQRPRWLQSIVERGRKKEKEREEPKVNKSRDLW